MKRGISTQVFIFIFALIMIVLVLWFGIKSLGTVKSTSDKVELLTFVSHFENAIEEYYNLDVGSSARKTFPLPKAIQQICFVLPGQPLTKPADSDFRFFITNNQKDNMYIFPLDAFTSPAPDFTLANLHIDPTTNPLCIQTQSKLSVLLETALYNKNIVVTVKP